MDRSWWLHMPIYSVSPISSAWSRWAIFFSQHHRDIRARDSIGSVLEINHHYQGNQESSRWFDEQLMTECSLAIEGCVCGQHLASRQSRHQSLCERIAAKNNNACHLSLVSHGCKDKRFVWWHTWTCLCWCKELVSTRTPPVRRVLFAFVSSAALVLQRKQTPLFQMLIFEGTRNLLGQLLTGHL